MRNNYDKGKNIMHYSRMRTACSVVAIWARSPPATDIPQEAHIKPSTWATETPHEENDTQM